MKKSRILDGVNQARFVPPYILSPLLAVIFVQGGQKLAYLAFEPISAVLSLMLGFLGQGGFFEIFFNFALPFLLFGFVFMILALFLWVRWVERRPLSTLGFVKKGSLVELVKGLAVGFLLFRMGTADDEAFPLYLDFASALDDSGRGRRASDTGLAAASFCQKDQPAHRFADFKSALCPLAPRQSRY